MVSIKTEDYASHVMRDSDAANTCLIVDGSNIATSGQPQFGERDHSTAICSDFSFLYGGHIDIEMFPRPGPRISNSNAIARLLCSQKQ